jgi:probable HAF family extracellular repeat protein
LKKKLIAFFGACALAAQATFASAAPSFTPLGYLPGGSTASGSKFAWADAVTPDGQVVAGTARTETGLDGFRWTRQGGMVALGFPDTTISNNKARDLSADGAIVAGDTGNSAYRVVSGVRTMITVPPIYTSGGITNVGGISADGGVVVGQMSGYYNNGGYRYEAYRWTPGGGAVGLGALAGAGNFRSTATDVSRDGNVVVGYSDINANPNTYSHAFRWTQATGMQSLGLLPGYVSGGATAIGADGTIVGSIGFDSNGNGSADSNHAMRYVNGQMQALGDLPGGMDAAFAQAVSGDGSVVVGEGVIDGFTIQTQVRRAFIWDAVNGMRNLEDVLTGMGVDLGDFHLLRATGISDDGTVIVGQALMPTGATQPFVAVVPEPGSAAVAGVIAAAMVVRRGRRRAQTAA